jgi:hypothetical protein
MRFRKLRIAWSVVWGTAVVLLIALWVRSYKVSELFRHGNGTTVIHIQTYRGEFGIAHWALAQPISWRHIVERIDESFAVRLFPSIEDQSPLSYVGIRWETIGAMHFFAIRYYSVVTLTVALVILPWLPWHFSIRTLLIATTLVAVVLGLAAVHSW